MADKPAKPAARSSTAGKPKPEVKAQPAKKPAAAPEATANGAMPDTAAMSDAEARQRAQASKMVAAAYGQIVSVLARSELHRGMTLADLEWMVAAPVVRRQFAIAERTNRKSGAVAPVAAVTWAFVSKEVDERLSANRDPWLTLAAGEWKCGDIPWIVEVVGDPVSAGNVLKRLSASVFKDTPPKIRVRNNKGEFAVGVLKPAGDAAEPDPTASAG